MVQRLFFAAILTIFMAVNAGADVTVHWLDQSPPAVPQGASWGVPWAAGMVTKMTTFGLSDARGKDVPVQTWPLAFWPDGSIKWTGFATTADDASGNELIVRPGKTPAAPAMPLIVRQTDAFVEITDGDVVWRMPMRGADLVDSISIKGKVVARSGRLVCQLEDRTDWESKQILRVEDFTSQVDSVTVEQSGPLRTVVKIQGKHKSDSGDRSWLPFIVRLYFFAGVDSVRMVHTFIFDGDQQKDFIRGIGIRFSVPMREEFQNRHVRLAGDQGFFAEPLQLIAGRRDPDPNLYAQQIAGKRVPNLDQQLPNASNVRHMAVWSGYKLTQLTADSFSIQKRTNAQSAWISAADGKRSMGMAFIGDVSGGLAVDLKNFWQLCPTELEVENASTDAADLTLWLWSPESPAMDMRHYDTVGHDLEASYEDVQPGHSSATGVARTSEIVLRPYPSVPSDDDLLKQAKADQQGALLVCTPEYYHSLPIFGLWSLPDRSSPGKRWIEDQLDKAFAFYSGQVEERHWYGFWDFGDVMHTYDTTRHEWRYDIGGFAWDNTELVPNLWLWYSFLRSGRPDIYRMAEALTRQSQEVDVYHLGPWKGLGSRHNVRHWGDGAKEVRISQSLLKRPYYYLTTDERTGDLMNEENDADQSLLNVDPLHELPGIADEHKYPTHLRIGPDWFALVSNWYTAWERTGDIQYRDKILVGMNCITSLKNGIASGENFGYDPKTAKIYWLKSGKTPSLLNLFGGPELNFEIDPVIDNGAWTSAWLALCERPGADNPDMARLTAYAAFVTKNPQQAAAAWQQFLKGGLRNSGGVPHNSGGERFDSHLVTGAQVPEPVDEIPFISTNSTSQWCLNAIELLQMVGDQMPKDDPAWRKTR